MIYFSRKYSLFLGPRTVKQGWFRSSDLSSTNLQYLSADQALADLAYFIEYLIEKGDIERGQKLMVFGGSYPGNLAAWARLKYPHLINAAISSSAPVFAKADFVGEFTFALPAKGTLEGRL